MKAKDTVMNFMRIEEIDAKNATSNFTDALVDVAREQAEISFKAGVKEVAEWIKQRMEHITGEKMTPYWQMELLEHEWQSKLKEWGISEN